MKAFTKILIIFLLVIIQISSVWAFSYQETADQINCVGSCWYAPHGCSQTYDADWNTYGECGGTSGTAYLYVNYTKPNGVQQSTSRWQVRDIGATTNLTIPSNCWGYDLTKLLLRVISTLSPKGNYWDCYNGTWNNLRYYNPGVNGPRVSEEAIWWDIATTTTTTQTTTTQTTTTSTATSTTIPVVTTTITTTTSSTIVSFSFKAWTQSPDFLIIGKPQQMNIYVQNFGPKDDYAVEIIGWQAQDYQGKDVSNLLNFSLTSNKIYNVNTSSVGDTFGTILLLGPIDTGTIQLKVSNSVHDEVITSIQISGSGTKLNLPEFGILGFLQLLAISSILFLSCRPKSSRYS